MQLIGAPDTMLSGLEAVHYSTHFVRAWREEQGYNVAEEVAMLQRLW